MHRGLCADIAAAHAITAARAGWLAHTGAVDLFVEGNVQVGAARFDAEAFGGNGKRGELAWHISGGKWRWGQGRSSAGEAVLQCAVVPDYFGPDRVGQHTGFGFDANVGVDQRRTTQATTDEQVSARADMHVEECGR